MLVCSLALDDICVRMRCILAVQWGFFFYQLFESEVLVKIMWTHLNAFFLINTDYTYILKYWLCLTLSVYGVG